MNLDIITPDKKVFSGDIKLIKVPGLNGSFEVMENHAPIVSTLSEGEVKVITPDGNETFYKVSGGIIEVLNNNVSVLIESIIE